MTALNQPENLINHFIDEMLKEEDYSKLEVGFTYPNIKSNLAKKNKKRWVDVLK